MRTRTSSSVAAAWGTLAAALPGMGDAGAAAAACEEGLDSELVGVDDEDGEREEACAEEDEEEVAAGEGGPGPRKAQLLEQGGRRRHGGSC